MFCGCGGMGLGFKQAGFDIVEAYDFDRYAVQSYNANIGNHAKQVDITTQTWEDMPKVDVWSFGFPCTNLSYSGNRAGLYKGEQSRLFFEVMRLLDETIKNNSDNLPKVIVAENVTGLKPYLGVLEEEYAKRGYKMYYTLYNSKYWGVPQSRERYFVVGTRLDKTFDFLQEKTDFIPKLSTILEKDVDERHYISDEKAKTIIEQALKRISCLGTVHATLTPDRITKKQNGRRAKEDEEPMYTLTTNDLHGIIIEEQPKIEVIGMLDTNWHDHSRRVHNPEGLSPVLS